MIHDLIYHAKRGPTKVQFEFLTKCFDTLSFDEIQLALEKLKITVFRIDHRGWVLEIIK